MTFTWPVLLSSIALVPLGLLAARAIDRRRRRRLGRLGGARLAATGDRGHRPDRWARLPGALFVGAFVLLGVAAARPVAAVSLPRAEGTVILVVDVSASMSADDVEPSRLEAAKSAAAAFVDRRPAGVVIGVVAFSDAGLSIQVPTDDADAVRAAIDRLLPARGTSVGQGILVALETIGRAEAGTPTEYYSNRTPAPSPTPEPVPPGSHDEAMVVLLSDGENNENPDPIEAARVAAARGIRIDTVGFGTVEGSTLELDGFQVRSRLDEATLRHVADVTGGTYHGADGASGLADIYGDLGRRLTVASEPTELSALFAVAAGLLLAGGGVLSLVRSGRLP